jgi:dihydrofolate synthase / folylpolyglutamate synthase
LVLAAHHFNDYLLSFSTLYLFISLKPYNKSMIITPLRTPKVRPNQTTLTQLLDDNLASLEEGSIVAITSKVISLCEGRVIAIDQADKYELMRGESEYYYRAESSRYRHHFTIARGTILGAAGIDESNGGGYYVLLPADIQASANSCREYLKDRFGLKKLGVIVTDSTSIPLRLGATGACLAYSGFRPIKDYRGKQDLFGRPFKIERSNIAEGLAAAAVLAMGEGDEQTPLCVISDNPLIEFEDKDPSKEDLKTFFLSLKDDLFGVFLDNGQWQKGGRGKL